MLKFVADHLKIKRTCKHRVKELHFAIRYVYVPSQYKSQ